MCVKIEIKAINRQLENEKFHCESKDRATHMCDKSRTLLLYMEEKKISSLLDFN